METKKQSETRAKRETREAEKNVEIQAIQERRNASTPQKIGLNKILFPVEIRDEELSANSEYTKRVVGIGIGENGSDMLLNQCSPRYELIPNSEIFPNIEDVLKSRNIGFNATYKHIQHVRFYGDYEINDARYKYVIPNTTDGIMPMLRVQHSYNGLTKYRIIFGYFRLICENGLVVSVQEMEKYNLVIVGKHTESIKHSFDKLNEMMIIFVNNAKQITKEITTKYDRLGGSWVAKPEDRLREVLSATNIIIVENNKFNTVNDIMNRITAESNNVNLGYNGKVNDWLIYNGVNQYLNDNKRNITVPEKRMETDSKVFEYMLATV